MPPYPHPVSHGIETYNVTKHVTPSILHLLMGRRGGGVPNTRPAVYWPQKHVRPIGGGFLTHEEQALFGGIFPHDPFVFDLKSTSTAYISDEVFPITHSLASHGRRYSRAVTVGTPWMSAAAAAAAAAGTVGLSQLVVLSTWLM